MANIYIIHLYLHGVFSKYSNVTNLKCRNVLGGSGSFILHNTPNMIPARAASTIRMAWP